MPAGRLVCTEREAWIPRKRVDYLVAEDQDILFFTIQHCAATLILDPQRYRPTHLRETIVSLDTSFPFLGSASL